MLGAICGDVIGSRHEFHPHRLTEFDLLHPLCRWTDDTVCTVAVADALMAGGDLGDTLAGWVQEHIDAGYGLDFMFWATSEHPRAPYGSWGNGSAMRCSPAAWLSDSLAEAVALAERTAAPTHDHHHGLRGAKATALATRMSLEGWSRDEIRGAITDRYGYDLDRTPDGIRPRYSFKVSCQRSVPEALVCALAATSFEEAVRLAVSLGGDADTQAAIAGAVAEPMFGIGRDLTEGVLALLTPEMRAVHARFRAATDGRAYPRTDLEAVPRDLPPEREGPDPFLDDKVTREMAKIEMLRRLSEARDGPLARAWEAIKRQIR